MHEAATALEDAVAGGGETVAPELDAGGDFVDDDDDDFDDDDDDDEVAAAESDESANEYPYWSCRMRLKKKTMFVLRSFASCSSTCI